MFAKEYDVIVVGGGHAGAEAAAAQSCWIIRNTRGISVSAAQDWFPGKHDVRTVSRLEFHALSQLFHAALFISYHSLLTPSRFLRTVQSTATMQLEIASKRSFSSSTLALI